MQSACSKNQQVPKQAASCLLTGSNKRTSSFNICVVLQLGHQLIVAMVIQQQTI